MQGDEANADHDAVATAAQEPGLRRLRMSDELFTEGNLRREELAKQTLAGAGSNSWACPWVHSQCCDMLSCISGRSSQGVMTLGCSSNWTDLWRDSLLLWA